MIPISNLEKSEKDNILLNNCSLCDEKHSEDSVKLPCDHIFHKSCIMGCIDFYMVNEKYKTIDFTCPYCTKTLSLSSLL